MKKRKFLVIWENFGKGFQVEKDMTVKNGVDLLVKLSGMGLWVTMIEYYSGRVVGRG